MKKLLTTIIIICMFAGLSLLSDEEKICFAVTPFIPLTESAEAENAGTNAASILENSFSSGKWFEFRKSGELQSFIDDLSLAQAGIGDENALLAKGKSLQIKYLTVGSVAKFGNHYEIDSRSVNIDNWGIMHSSGCSAIDVESACNFINKDVEITLTREDLEKKEKETANLPIIAVSRFEEGNLEAQNAGYGGAFSEVLNSELGARSKIAAVERTHLKSVIDAKEIEMCGIYGSGTDKAFSERGIQYRVDGEIKIFPSSICIRYKVNSTTEERTVYMGFSEIGSLNGIRPLARKIAQEIEDAINNKIGTLQIQTQPSSADIVIDGQPSGKSPLVVSLVKGEHSIRASFQGYESTDISIVLEPARVTEKIIKLEKISTELYDQAVNLEQRKNWEGAVAKYDEYINRYNTSGDVNRAVYRKGHIQLLYLNDAEGALATFESLVKRYPDSETRAEAYFGMARSYKSLKDNENLKSILEILYQKYPNELATEEAGYVFGGRY